MHMKAFSPYSIINLADLQGDTSQVKLARSVTPVARLQGVGQGGPIHAYFGTTLAEYDFIDFVSSLDDEFFKANVPEIAEGHPVPTKLQDRSRYILGAMVHKTLQDIELLNRCRDNTLFRLKGDLANQYRTLKVPYSESIKISLKRDMGDALELILNESIS